MANVLGVFRRNFITFEAARSEAYWEQGNVELTAVPCSDSTLERPKWIFEFRDSKGAVRVLGSRSGRSRPFYANAPSGIYGVGAELGVSQVVMKLPTSMQSDEVDSS